MVRRWTKIRGEETWITDWERGSAQVVRRLDPDPEVADWAIVIFENGKLIQQEWAFTKKAAQGMANHFIPTQQ